MKFDVLKDFNIFAHNEIVMKNADCEGVMAVSRNLVLENYSVGVGYSPFECEKEINSLVAGGKVKIKNSTNYNGNTCLQKNKFANYCHMNTPNGRVVYRKLVDFESCYNNSVEISKFLSNQKINTIIESSTQRNDVDTLHFKNLYNDEVLHFFVKAEDLSRTSTINFDVDSRSLIFVNVLGNRVDFSNINVLINNKAWDCESARNLFWNFVDTAEIFINNMDFYGTIFSTSATLSCINSRLFANVYCFNIYGNSDIYLCKLSANIVRYLNGVLDINTNIYQFQNIKEHRLEKIENNATLEVEQKADNEYLEITNQNNKQTYDLNELEVLKNKLITEQDFQLNYEKAKTVSKVTNIYINNLKQIENSLIMLLIAEGERYEKAIELATCVNEHLQINRSVIRTLKSIKTAQILINERLGLVESLGIEKQNFSFKTLNI